MKKKNYEIRTIRDGDFTEWKGLFEKYLKFYETTVTHEVLKKTFERLTNSDKKNQNGLVAQKDSKLIGFAHFIYHPHNWKVEDVCYLQDLFVEEKFRGFGVAYSLMTSIYSEADKHKTPTVYWLTQDFNMRARKLYDRVGAKTAFIRYNRA